MILNIIMSWSGNAHFVILMVETVRLDKETVGQVTSVCNNQADLQEGGLTVTRSSSVVFT